MKQQKEVRRTRLRSSNVTSTDGRQSDIGHGRSSTPTSTNTTTRSQTIRMISYTTGSTFLLQLLSYTQSKYGIIIMTTIMITIFIMYQKDIVMNQLLLSGTSTTKSSTSTSELSMINKRRNPSPLSAIIHVGPLKTGSSSIQETLMSFRQRNVLKKDDYVYGNYYFSKDAGHFIDNARRFSDCYVKNHKVSYSHDPKNYCNETIIQYISNISAVKKSNVIISSEWLSGDGIQLDLLYQFFSYYWNDIYIIMYYRRFYDWILSFHNQGQKYRKANERKTILYVTRFVTEQHDSFFEKQYIGQLYKRYNQYFVSNDNGVNSYINVINMHHNDVRLSFFCNKVIPHSTHMCNEYHEDVMTKKNKQKPHDENRKQLLIYEEIAYYAKLHNIINYTEFKEKPDINRYTMTEMIELIQKYHDSIITNTNNYHDGFPINSVSCLTDAEYKILYDKSLMYEQMMGLNDTNNEFDIMFQQLKSKFCHLNASLIIQDTTWNTFLKSIKKE